MMIPQELRRILPRFIQELADRRGIFPVAAFMFGVLGYLSSASPITARHLLAPVLGLALAGLFLTVRPWNPYNSRFADDEGKSPETVRHDDAAQRLLHMLRSKEARVVMWLVCLRAAPVFVCLVIAWSLLMPLSPSPITDFETFLLLTMIWVVPSTGLLIHFLLRWVIAKW